MTNRRNFLNPTVLFVVALTLSAQWLFAENLVPPKPVKDGLFAVSYGRELHKRSEPRTITIPNVGEYQVLKGDFHIHTLFSDGQVMPKDRVLEAMDNGLDVISITDHIEYHPNLGSNALKFAENNDDRNRSYNIAKAEADKMNLILVPGAEITKSARHFNALFVTDVNAIAAVVDDWRAMIAVAVDQGAFIHWNHPNWTNRDTARDPGGLKQGDPMRFFDEHEELWKKGHLHGIEVFNGSTHYPIALDWCNERDLVPMVNSDIHQSEWNSYGHQNRLRPMTLILAKDRSYESVKEAFFAKRIVGWAPNMILGRAPWVEELFRSCVEIKKDSGNLTLKNLSDLPCLIEAGGKSYQLLPMGSVTIDGGESLTKLTVSNWFTGMTKPLEIAL